MRSVPGNVVLVGFMGAGKSACGRLLARRLGPGSRSTRGPPSRWTRPGRGSTRSSRGSSPRSGTRMPHAFSRRLAEGPLLCDGAMGTMLYARGGAIDACFDVLNLNNPGLVQSVHKDYVAAGADCLETNTFGANRFLLAAHNLEGRVREINRAG